MFDWALNTHLFTRDIFIQQIHKQHEETKPVYEIISLDLLDFPLCSENPPHCSKLCVASVYNEYVENKEVAIVSSLPMKMGQFIFQGQWGGLPFHMDNGGTLSYGGSHNQGFPWGDSTTNSSPNWLMQVCNCPIGKHKPKSVKVNLKVTSATKQ